MFDYFKQRFRAWRRDRRAIIQLHALDDHLLADMGIERRDIRRRVRRAAANDGYLWDAGDMGGLRTRSPPEPECRSTGFREPVRPAAAPPGRAVGSGGVA